MMVEGAEIPTTVGFIGLGTMGLPMTLNLVRRGFTVTGYNRTEAKTERLVEAGGAAAASIAEASDADVVAIMVSDTPDVEDVLAGVDGVFDHAKAGTLVIDFSTIRPDATRRLAASAHSQGLRMLDAPVSGGEQGAIDGSLAIMIGGDSADFEIAKPVFEAVGKTIVHVGPSGSGQTVKAANQLLVAGTIELVAEALVFLEAHKVDLTSAIEVLKGGLANNAILERKAEAMIARNYTPGFKLTLHHKDLGIVQAAAREVGVSIPLGAAVSQLVGSLVSQGRGHLDHSALLDLIEGMSGRKATTEADV